MTNDWRVIHGDCREAMASMVAESIDAIVCDPPYGLAFMGKEWDRGVPGVPFWAEALRVAKPGAHLLAFGGTRTYHRLACAIEDAGWEIRDCLSWLYGSGFPKSHNGPWGGTALKPAWEPIILARKPLAGTVAANVQRHGTGAINVDGCRIAGAKSQRGERLTALGCMNDDGWQPRTVLAADHLGRWPANVALDEEAAAMLDEQSGERSSGSRAAGDFGMMGFNGNGVKPMPQIDGDSGGASRFFYTAKASRSEREIGLDFAVPAAGIQSNAPRLSEAEKTPARTNHHPTVKPVELMRWLVRLVTPPGGTVLDPFAGSGSTLIAALREGFSCIGIECEAAYVEIAKRRIEGDSPLLNRAAQ